MLKEEQSVIETKAGKHTTAAYTDKVRSCCYYLLSKNFGTKNVGPVIEQVVTTFTEKEIGPLPSETQLCRMQREAGDLAKIQLTEAMLEAQNVTLHTDGTSKLGHHYSGAQVTVEGRSYSMSLDEIASGSADNYFNSVIGAFTDCERHMQYMSPTVSDISKKLIGSCKNLMSDKHVVEAKFATQFEETTRECLPSIIQG